MCVPRRRSSKRTGRTGHPGFSSEIGACAYTWAPSISVRIERLNPAQPLTAAAGGAVAATQYAVSLHLATSVSDRARISGRIWNTGSAGARAPLCNVVQSMPTDKGHDAAASRRAVPTSNGSPPTGAHLWRVRRNPPLPPRRALRLSPHHAVRPGRPSRLVGSPARTLARAAAHGPPPRLARYITRIPSDPVAISLPPRRRPPPEVESVEASRELGRDPEKRPNPGAGLDPR